MIDHVALLPVIGSVVVVVVARGTLDHSAQVIYQCLQMCESALHAFVHVTLACFCICAVQRQQYTSGLLCDVTPA